MSKYHGRRNRRDNKVNVDDVLIRTDRVNVIEGENDRKGRHCCHDRRDRCNHHHDRRLVINVDDVTILADDVFVGEDDRHHNGCGCHHGRR